MSSPSPQVVVLGDVMTDVVVRLSAPIAYASDSPSRVVMAGGGSAANVACWLAAAGVPVALVGRVGDDAAGRLAAADLAAYGVVLSLAVDPDRPTGTCVVLVTPDGERSMLPDPGANAALAVADLPDALVGPGRHLHLSGYPLLHPGAQPAALAALRLARARGASVSVDPASAAPLAAVGADAWLSWTSGDALCLANADEARVLTGHGEPFAAVRALATRYAAAVVKLGAAGAVWCAAGGEPVAVPAEPTEPAGPSDPADPAGPFDPADPGAPTVVDTTGAGDAFAAGFLSAYLSGAQPAEALGGGCRLAARAVRLVGARPPLPTPPLPTPPPSPSPRPPGSPE
ncbi:sugar kinase [soil metagenome]